MTTPVSPSTLHNIAGFNRSWVAYARSRLPKARHIHGRQSPHGWSGPPMSVTARLDICENRCPGWIGRSGKPEFHPGCNLVMSLSIFKDPGRTFNHTGRRGKTLDFGDSPHLFPASVGALEPFFHLVGGDSPQHDGERLGHFFGRYAQGRCWIPFGGGLQDFAAFGGLGFIIGSPLTGISTPRAQAVATSVRSSRNFIAVEHEIYRSHH